MKALVSLIAFLSVGTTRVLAVPVVPNFQSGSTSSTTTSTQKTVELIETWEYQTGFEYSLGGTNLSVTGKLTPDIVTVGTHSVNGVTTTHYGANLNTLPTATMHTQGASTNLLNSYHGPGLKNFTRISRDITTESITETMSTFTQ